MDLRITQLKSFNLLLILLIVVEIILLVTTAMFFLSTTNNVSSLGSIITSVLLFILCVPISVILYRRNTDEMSKLLFLCLAITLILLSISGVLYLVNFNFVIEMSYVLMIFSYLPLLYSLYKIYNEQKNTFHRWIRVFIFYINAMLILLILGFVAYNVFINKTSIFETFIFSSAVVFDVIIMALTTVLIFINMPTKFRYPFIIIFSFYLFSFLGDIFRLYGYLNLYDTIGLSEYFYAIMVLFISFALLVYVFSNIRMVTIEEVNKKLEDTSLLVEDMILQSPDSMCVCDPSGVIVKSNNLFFETFNLNPENCINKINIFNFDFGFEEKNSDLFHKAKLGEIVTVDTIKYNINNVIKYFSIKLYPTYTSDKKSSGYILIIENVSIRKNAEDTLKNAYNDLEQRVKERTAELSLLNQALQNEIAEHKIDEERIKSSLKEKEILLKEIHHRVKNNMQIISSMLGLQSGFIEDKILNDILRDSQNRIKSMALIHEKLYQSENMANINFNEYINSLVRNLYNSYTIDSSRIKLITNIDDISFNIDMAIPLGLITNELISNSLKHAFPAPRSGVIEIEIKRIDTNNYELIVNDNGIGLPDGFNIEESKSLGLKLVSVLVEQINGNIIINSNNGASFTIHFSIN